MDGTTAAGSCEAGIEASLEREEVVVDVRRLDALSASIRTRATARAPMASVYRRMVCWLAGGDVFGAPERTDRTGLASRAARDTARPSAMRAPAPELVPMVATLRASVPTVQWLCW